MVDEIEDIHKTSHKNDADMSHQTLETLFGSEVGEIHLLNPPGREEDNAEFRPFASRANAWLCVVIGIVGESNQLTECYHSLGKPDAPFSEDTKAVQLVRGMVSHSKHETCMSSTVGRHMVPLAYPDLESFIGASQLKKARGNDASYVFCFVVITKAIEVPMTYLNKIPRNDTATQRPHQLTTQCTALLIALNVPFRLSFRRTLADVFQDVHNSSLGQYKCATFWYLRNALKHTGRPASSSQHSITRRDSSKDGQNPEGPAPTEAFLIRHEGQASSSMPERVTAMGRTHAVEATVQTE